RYVMEALKERNWRLGGENSGHIISLDQTTTGDGIVAALQVVSAMLQSGKTLHELKGQMTRYPQVLVNVETVRGYQVGEDAAVSQAAADLEQQLGEAGRILLRPSGTEPVVRVMVEGEDTGVIRGVANQLADVVRSGVSGFAAGG
ncbi:MAG: phosphoglucosamine mutase, partial [Gammaproteobacteria bacterium]